MKTKEVEIEGKKYTVKEIGYLDSVELQDSKEKGTRVLISKLLTLSTGMTEEELVVLSRTEGEELQKAVNDINGLSPLPKPTKE